MTFAPARMLAMAAFLSAALVSATKDEEDTFAVLEPLDSDENEVMTQRPGVGVGWEDGPCKEVGWEDPTGTVTYKGEGGYDPNKEGFRTFDETAATLNSRSGYANKRGRHECSKDSGETGSHFRLCGDLIASGYKHQYFAGSPLDQGKGDAAFNAMCYDNNPTETIFTYIPLFYNGHGLGMSRTIEGDFWLKFTTDDQTVCRTTDDRIKKHCENLIKEKADAEKKAADQAEKKAAAAKGAALAGAKAAAFKKSMDKLGYSDYCTGFESVKGASWGSLSMKLKKELMKKRKGPEKKFRLVKKSAVDGIVTSLETLTTWVNDFVDEHKTYLCPE